VLRAKTWPGRTELLGDFHVRMAELMGNEVLAQMLGELISRCALITLMYQTQRRRALQRRTRRHRQGAGRQDEERAVQLMDEHLTHVEASLTFDRKLPTHDICDGPLMTQPIYDTTLPYPRDLVGYGRNPPHASWPGGARIAVQFVLNYEEGGENAVLHGDAGSEQFLSEMFNPASLPRPAPEHGRHLRIRLARGRVAPPARVRKARPAADRVWRGMALQRHPELTAAFVELGHEIACHGWRWITTRTSTKPPSASTCASAWTSSRTSPGQRPLGWYTGRDSPNTRRLVADDGGFAYDSDYYGDDLPFWMKVQKTDGAWCRTWSCRTRWTPTTCASRCRRAFRRATTSSPTCATASMCCTPKATRPAWTAPRC
jgi:peptidoglycan/xylan/chitin deacetylase (PgdA/CDA1 family)